MDDSSKTETESNSQKEMSLVKQPNYWRSEKGYKRKYQFREKRNYQVSEICILMLLLNDKYSIDLVKTTLRKSKMTYRLVKIKSIMTDGEILDIEDFIINRCEEKYKYDLRNGT